MSCLVFALPDVVLKNPTNNDHTTEDRMFFSCSFSSNSTCNEFSFYHNIDGEFGPSGGFPPTSCNSLGMEFTIKRDKFNIPDGEYIWNCLFKDFEGKSSFADENFSFIVDTIAPDSVEGLEVVDVGVDYVSLKWVNPSDSDYSNVVISLDGNYLRNVFEDDEVTLTNLSFSTDYEVGLKTQDEYGNVNTEDVSVSFTTLDLVEKVEESEINNDEIEQEDEVEDSQESGDIMGDVDQGVEETDTDTDEISGVEGNARDGGFDGNLGLLLIIAVIVIVGLVIVLIVMIFKKRDGDY